MEPIFTNRPYRRIDTISKEKIRLVLHLAKYELLLCSKHPVSIFMKSCEANSNIPLQASGLMDHVTLI